MLLLLASAAFVCPRLVGHAASAVPAPEPQRPRRGRARRPSPARPSVDYTKFSHRIPQHQQEACDSCHKSPTANWQQARDKDSAFPDITDYPEHASCLSCHRQQFFRGARPPICSVCHTAVSPRASARFPFENPAESFARSEKSKGRQTEFSLNFPHDRHQDVMARFVPSFESGSAALVRASFEPQAQKRPVDSCSICHETYTPPGKPASQTAAQPAQPAAGASALPVEGMFKTTPASHASCFNCHWQDGGERPLSSDCAGCHKLLPQGKTQPQPQGKDADAQTAARAGITDPLIIAKLLRRDTATFSHDDDHHKARGCTACHINITGISLLDERTLKVPILTCGGSSCHINPKPKRVLNDEVGKREADPTFQCTKCHINYGKSPVPRSHLDAVGSK